MTIYKCKMCGGTLEITEGSTVAECEYCGTRQTVPSLDNEKKVNLFTRANRLRTACEFDKAFGVYESIVAEFPEEAEAYWGLILCKYGIEYVDDPHTGKKIPTCHRSSFDGVFDDANFELVMEYSDSLSRAVYREEAKEIERLRTRILEVSSKEEPYDIFICYKETDENGNRTIDSVIAQDVYDVLTEKGYKVFFSRITLEDKLGQEYEPYIFAALNSAKVMLAFGTDYEYYNAVWVKNEWSRYLSLIEKGERKVLIPCYKGIDAYDMPAEFKRLQAQDMGKIGAVQDLVRGIEKIIGKKSESGNDENARAFMIGLAAQAAPLLKRAFMFLEDGNWSEAENYCEKALDLDPENGEAYLGKLMAELEVRKREDLASYTECFDESENYWKAIKYGDESLVTELKVAISSIRMAKIDIRKTIEFGSYPQSQDTVKQKIEWIVLDRNESRALLISKYALDVKPFNAKHENVTWGTCSLRSWLNEVFYTNAFSTREQELIREITVAADKNPEYRTDPGNDTKNKIFLLSINEVNKYLKSTTDRICIGTEYCYAHGALKNSEGNCWWWLRSPGFDQDYAAYVYLDGAVFTSGSTVDIDDGAIRPALWINLEP